MTDDPLHRPIQYLKGVGPRRVVLFERLGVKTLGDLLTHYPRLWQDRHETPDLKSPTGGLVVLRGRVLRAGTHGAGPRLGIYSVTLATAHGKVDCLWFKHLSRSYDAFASLKSEAAEGADLWVIGRAEPDLTGVPAIAGEAHLRARRGVCGRQCPVWVGDA